MQDVSTLPSLHLPSPSTLQREHSSAFTATLSVCVSEQYYILITEKGCRYKDPLSAFRCL